jgi:MYXO-CTERM domain-containing protein
MRRRGAKRKVAPPPAGPPKLAFGFALIAIVALARRRPRR